MTDFATTIATYGADATYTALEAPFEGEGE